MSQMLVRIDEEIDKALTYIYENKGYVINQFGVMAGIVRRIYKQWKPNHEAMLKLIEEEKEKATTPMIVEHMQSDSIMERLTYSANDNSLRNGARNDQSNSL